MSLELNKAAAAVLTAGLVAMGSGFVADLLVHPEELEDNAYPIAVEGGGETSQEMAEEPVLESVLPLLASADVGAGEGEFRACSACHNIAEGAGNKVGPNLWGVVGREVAAAEGFSYSAALAEDHAGAQWTYENLNAFLAGPQDWAPGTKMAYGGLDDVEDRANLIAWMRAQGSSDYALPTEEEIAAATASEEEAAEEAAGGDEAAAEEEMAAEDEMASEEMAAAEEGAGGDAGGALAMVAAADPADGKTVFNQCGACHSVEKGGGRRVGPNLYGVTGSAVAGDEDFSYSDALASWGEGKTWTIENLWSYLEAPMEVVPGTRMTYRGLADEEDRAAVIRYLNEQSDEPLPLE